MMIFPSAVWVLATVSAFINRTVFTERGVDQRMLLRGRQSIDYTDIRSIKLSGWDGVKAAYLYANDGRQIVIMGNAGQISLAESIMRSRMSPQA